MAAQDYVYQVSELVEVADFITLNLTREAAHYTPSFISKIMVGSHNAKITEVAYAAILE